MSETLVTLIREHEVGRIRRKRQGRLSVTYDERWRASPGGAHPLSLSMPLAAAQHESKAIGAFIWGFSRTTNTY